MPRWANFAIYLAVGWLIAWAAFRLGLSFGATLGVIAVLGGLAAYFLPRLYLWYLAPAKVHSAVRGLLQPGFVPPQGTETRLELYDRLERTAAASDWRALKALLADDFAYVDGTGRRHGMKMYLCTLQNMERMYPRLEQTESILADPYDPNVFYIRATTFGQPRRGPVLDMVDWSRLEAAPGHAQVRELASIGVERVA